LTGSMPYLKIAFLAITAAMVLSGVLTLILQNCSNGFGAENRERLSLLLHIPGTLLFIISFHPYAAALSFLLLGIKVFLLIKIQ